MDEWIYDKELKVYLFGEENNGCGVFFERDGWCGRVCLDLYNESFGYFDNVEDAKDYALDILDKLKEIFSKKS